MVVSNPEAVLLLGVAVVLPDVDLEDWEPDLGPKPVIEGTLELMVHHPVGDTMFHCGGAALRSSDRNVECTG